MLPYDLLQVLLPAGEAELGSIVMARILSASRWSCKGEVVASVGIVEVPRNPANSIRGAAEGSDDSAKQQEVRLL